MFNHNELPVTMSNNIAREFISTKTSNCNEIINTTSTNEGSGCYNTITTNDTMASHCRFQDAYWISASLFFPHLLGSCLYFWP